LFTFAILSNFLSMGFLAASAADMSICKPSFLPKHSLF
jgi:hypothetical protein